MRVWLILAAFLAVCVSAFADDRPVPRAVATCTEKRDAAVAKARKAYFQAVLAAEKQCVLDLQAAATAAAKSGKTDLVVQLAEAKKAAEQRYVALREEAEGTIVYDLTQKGTMDRFTSIGPSEIVEGKGLELPSGKRSVVVSKDRFTYPISVTFNVYAEADGVLDVFPAIFVQGEPNMDAPKLSLAFGTDWNRATYGQVFGRDTKLPHTPIQPNRVYEIRIAVDRNKRAVMQVDGQTVFETTIENANLLSGPIMLNGGAGHVVYTRVAVEGRRAGAEMPE